LVEDERLARILQLTPVDAASALLDAALLAGGRDNVSLILDGVR
jgi:serine/threonine protein phosphatase PrpC